MIIFFGGNKIINKINLIFIFISYINKLIIIIYINILIILININK